MDGNAAAPVRGELALWRAVIAQALEDASGHPGALNGWDVRRGTSGRVVEAARQWFREAGPAFATVCELAGLEPAAVRRAALAWLEEHRGEHACRGN